MKKSSREKRSTIVPTLTLVQLLHVYKTETLGLGKRWPAEGRRAVEQELRSAGLLEETSGGASHRNVASPGTSRRRDRRSNHEHQAKHPPKPYVRPVERDR